MRSRLAALFFAALVTGSGPAGAQVRFERLAEALEGIEAPRARGARHVAGAERLAAIIEAKPGTSFSSLGVSRVSERFGVARASLDELAGLARAHPELRVMWSAPLHPLLDRAAPAIGAPAFRNTTGATGRGVVVGIVDTGLDVTHPDLREADGSTRVDWLIDFSRSPRGVHPELEDRCTTGGLSCAVFSGDDLDALIAEGDPRKLPGDFLGHGTHVASLAAGNGLAEPPGKYVGIAPEASLIVARVTDQSASIADSDVLKAVELVYYLAGEHRQAAGLEPMPVVVNMSLGSDFGPHDGSSPLSKALAAFVGDDQPGRALVVAAGNSGSLLSGVERFPNPLGVHTEVRVNRGMSTRVPLVTIHPHASRGTFDASMFVWIGIEPGDDVSVGVDRRSGRWIPPVEPGRARGVEDGDVVVTIVNGTSAEPIGRMGNVEGALVVIEGNWPVDETFAVRLEGPATASLWVQSDGDLGPARGLGALFPAAIKEGTVGIPAAHPEIISVGATLDRVEWTDRVGDRQTIDRFGAVEGPRPGDIAFFTAAGPNADGAIKPDIVAPGAFVVGAMSREADPADNPLSVFAEGGCEPVADCSVVDARHAVTSGTSMASPIVAGAVALLLERRPELTQSQIRGLLQAGARSVQGGLPVQRGAGAVDLERTLAALDGADARRPSAESAIVVAQSFARPGDRTPVEALIQLRDDSGLPADASGDGSVSVQITRGRLVDPPERVAPGLWRFAFVASEGTGGAAVELTALVDGSAVATERLPVAVDALVVDRGFAARGGCGVAGKAPAAPWWAVGLALAAATAWRGRRYSRAARTARNRDRRGRSGSGRRGSCPR